MSEPAAEPELPVLLDPAKIAARVRELAAEISRDYQGRTPHLVGVLKGAWVFMADLIRHLSIPWTVDFLGIESYGAGATSSGEVKITKDLTSVSRAARFSLSKTSSTQGERFTTCRECSRHTRRIAETGRAARQALASRDSCPARLRRF